MNLLLSAYACEPHKGSEPEVGWSFALGLAKHHRVWVLTRANNRPSIEDERRRIVAPNLSFLYFDLPVCLRFWKRGQFGVQVYYYLWQIGAYFVARRAHRRYRFDISHHVTFVKYWAPSAVCLLPIPFVWGPVGGGESAPKSFWPYFGVRGFCFEAVREAARWLFECDPFVRKTARSARIAMATSGETARRLRALGVQSVRVVSQLSISNDDLLAIPDTLPEKHREREIVFAIVGSLIPLKGFALAVEAYARARPAYSQLWIMGDGPEYSKLKRLVEELKISASVAFLGHLKRTDVLDRLRQCHILLHPTLHDSGGWVCIEAMAAACIPVCFDLGGPGVHVDSEVGVKVEAKNPTEAVERLAEAIRMLVSSPNERESRGRRALDRVKKLYSRQARADEITSIYSNILACPELC